MNSQAQLSAAQQLASGGGSSGVPNLEGSSVDREPADDDDIPELEAVEEDGNIDETGVDPKDIELVIQQVGCTRAKAVRVLKESGGDLINASAYSCFLLCCKALLTFDLQSWPQASDLLYWVSLYSTSLLCPHVQNIPFGVLMTSPHLCDRVSQDFTEKITHRFQKGSLFPSTQFYEVVRPLPAILDDLHAVHRPSFWFAHLQAHLLRSLRDELVQLTLCEHMVIAIKHLACSCRGLLRFCNLFFRALLIPTLTSPRSLGLGRSRLREHPWHKHILAPARGCANLYVTGFA